MNVKELITEYPVKDYPEKEEGKSISRRELKLALIKKYGVCYWCKCKVYDYPHKDKAFRPKDTATIDHLISKPEGRKKGEIVEKVLCCDRCNTKRGIAVYKTLSKKESFIKSI